VRATHTLSNMSILLQRQGAYYEAYGLLDLCHTVYEELGDSFGIARVHGEMLIRCTNRPASRGPRIPHPCTTQENPRRRAAVQQPRLRRPACKHRARRPSVRVGVEGEAVDARRQLLRRRPGVEAGRVEGAVPEERRQPEQIPRIRLQVVGGEGVAQGVGAGRRRHQPPPRFSGTIDRIMEGALGGVYTLLLAEELLGEFRETITTKPYLRDRIDRAQAAAFIEGLRAVAELLPALEEEFPAITRDPNDDYLLAQAIFAGADYLVSSDRDLRSLGPVGGLTILSPADFAQRL